MIAQAEVRDGNTSDAGLRRLRQSERTEAYRRMVLILTVGRSETQPDLLLP